MYAPINSVRIFLLNYFMILTYQTLLCSNLTIISALGMA